MIEKNLLPPELIPVREAAQRALGAVRPGQITNLRALLNGSRSRAGQGLPPYYLVYFLLVDLLGFRNLGRFDKVAWSVPLNTWGQPT
jgi:hypothetical protein